jgi:hypothetical protein
MADLPIKWTPPQIRLINWLALPKYERIPPNQELLADELGVDPGTLTRWKRKEGIQEEVNRIAKAGLSRAVPEVYGALIREAERGSIQHIRTVLELIGDLGGQVTEGATQIAIVFNDKTVQANTDPMEADAQSTSGVINLLPVQRGGHGPEVGQNGHGQGSANGSTNSDR